MIDPMTIRMRYAGVCQLLCRLAGKKNYEYADKVMVGKALRDFIDCFPDSALEIVEATGPSGYSLDMKRDAPSPEGP